MNDNRQLNMMDLINIISFVIGIANYNENIDQSTLQSVAESIMQTINKHLEVQDRKLNYIISKLEKEV